LLIVKFLIVLLDSLLPALGPVFLAKSS